MEKYKRGNFGRLECFLNGISRKKQKCINLIRSNVCLGHEVFIEYKLSILKSIPSLG